MQMNMSMTSQDVFTDATSTATTEATISKLSTAAPDDEKLIQSMTDISDGGATDDSQLNISHSANADEGAKQMSEQDEELARLQAELRALEDEMSTYVDDSTDATTNVENIASRNRGDNDD